MSIDDDLSPAAALDLAAQDAGVVYDACGCGGAECRLDCRPMRCVICAAGVGPVKRPGKDGRADLERWRSPTGRDLVVVAVDVSRGDAIPRADRSAMQQRQSSLR